MISSCLRLLERRYAEELDEEVTREDLPAACGNREQIRRVLQNLVENALTYHGDDRR